MKKFLRIAGLVLGHLLFWGWNLQFLALLVFGVGPVFLFETVEASLLGLVPWFVGVFVPLVYAVPAAAMVLGAWKFRSDPGRLLSLFYGVQAPLMLLCLFRLFGLGQLTASTGLLLGAFTLGALSLLRTLLVGSREERPSLQVLRLVGQSAYLVVGLWLSVLLGLVLLPAAVSLLWELPETLSRTRFGVDNLLGLGFLIVSIGVFALFPAAMIGLTARGWQLALRSCRATLGSAPALALSGVTVAALVLAMGLAGQQPQHRAFALLDAATDPAGRAEALEQSERIRAGLRFAYLNSYLTLGEVEEDSWVEESWSEVGLGRPARALWRASLWPLAYQPVRGGAREDSAAAREAYASFFDTPIERGELATIQEAMRNTWNWRQAAAGLLDVGEQRVWLESQALELEPHGDHATLMVHEVYRNTTWRQEEVLLSFSLPPGAVLSGLWLGATPDRDEAFTHVVAPRGAAQEIYEQEVRNSVDPALLEQVGPRQYRLRAFPVLAKEGSETLEDLHRLGAPLHLWMRVELWSVEEEGARRWPLPRLAEVRNLFWDEETLRTLDGRPVEAEGWMPAWPEAAGAEPRAQEGVVSGQRVRVRPEAGPAPRAEGLNLAVVVDRSYSMGAHREPLAAALEALAEDAANSERFFGPSSLEAMQFFGSASVEELLLPVEEALNGGEELARTVDAVVVLTDAGSYELSGRPPASVDRFSPFLTGRRERWEGAQPGATEEAPDRGPLELPPLWLVHLDGDFPQAYDDRLLDSLESSGGGVVASVDELLVALAGGLRADGRVFEVEAQSEEAEATPLAESGDASLDRLLARQWMRQRAAGAEREGEAWVAALDELHAVAVGQDLVTPWSSLIVLVNAAQLERLEAASQRADRFDREVLDAQGGELFSSAPEPEQWALLAIAALALLGLRKRGLAGGAMAAG